MNNINRIQHAIKEREYDALLVTNRINRLFATGFQSSAGMLFITERDAWFFTDSRYIEAASAVITGVNVHKVTDDAAYHKQIKELLNDNSINSLGFEDNSITYSEYCNMKEKLDVELVPVKKLISNLRCVKSIDDLDNLKKAQHVAEKSFLDVLPLINTEITEKELASELQYRFMKYGADDKSFDTIVVSGPKSSMPHGVPGDVKIGKGFLTIDFGVRLNGWCSDTTRTLCVGKPDSEMIKVYDTVLKAQEAGIGAVRAGVSGRDVDAEARAVIDAAGYGECFGHGFGHGLGLDVHEPPRASKTSEDVLEAGAVVSAEPGIYLPGRYGVRIEDILYVTGSGSENITNLTKELIVI